MVRADPVLAFIKLKIAPLDRKRSLQRGNAFHQSSFRRRSRWGSLSASWKGVFGSAGTARPPGAPPVRGAWRPARSPSDVFTVLGFVCSCGASRGRWHLRDFAAVTLAVPLPVAR